MCFRRKIANSATLVCCHERQPVPSSLALICVEVVVPLFDLVSCFLKTPSRRRGCCGASGIHPIHKDFELCLKFFVTAVALDPASLPKPVTQVGELIGGSRDLSVAHIHIERDIYRWKKSRQEAQKGCDDIPAPFGTEARQDL